MNMVLQREEKTTLDANIAQLEDRCGPRPPCPFLSERGGRVGFCLLRAAKGKQNIFVFFAKQFFC